MLPILISLLLFPGSRIVDIRTDEAQTDVKDMDMKEAGAQTVMTLCNIAYASPAGSPLPKLASGAAQKGVLPVGPGGPHKATEGCQQPAITKTKALEMSKDNSKAATLVSATDASKHATSPNTAQVTVPIPITDAPIKPPRRARLTRWERRISTESEDSPKAKEKGKSTNRTASPRCTSSASSSGSPSSPTSATTSTPESFTFKEEEEPVTKPPISPTRRKRSPMAKKKASTPSPEKPASPKKVYSISVPYPSHDKSPNLPRTENVSVPGDSNARAYLSKLDDALNSGHEETYLEYKMRTSCPPHSPMIRSKYPRKLKVGETRPLNYNGDSRTWQATPPRRLIRHRKTSTEKRPDISSLIEGDLSVNAGRIAQHDDHDEAWRSRALSDSHPALHKDSFLSVPTSNQHHSGSQQEYKQMPVSDVISKFERQSLSGSSGEVFRKSPSPGAIGRPTVSPVHRLKTAEELLHECSHKQQRRSSAGNGMDRLSPGRDKFPSTSSDKENDKQRQTVIQSSSPQSTPEWTREKGSPKPGAFVSQAIRKLSVPDSELKPPLHDKTHETNAKDSPKALHTSQDPRLIELPRLGIVSKQAELFQAKIGAESRQGRQPAPLALGGTDYNIKRNSAHKSSPDSSLPDSPDRRTKSPDRLHLPRSIAPNSSPQTSRSKGYSKFFARKVSPSSPTANKNTVSTLCKQALHVQLDSAADGAEAAYTDPECTETDRTASPDRRRTKNKFLDSTWLQKPRRFFKVSKYVYFVHEHPCMTRVTRITEVNIFSCASHFRIPSLRNFRPSAAVMYLSHQWIQGALSLQDFFQNHAVFRQLFRKKTPIFSKFWALPPPTKILDPRLCRHSKS